MGHVEFRLWQERYAYDIVDDVTLFIIDTLKLNSAYYLVYYRIVYRLRCPPMG